MIASDCKIVRCVRYEMEVGWWLVVVVFGCCQLTGEQKLFEVVGETRRGGVIRVLAISRPNARNNKANARDRYIM